MCVYVIELYNNRMIIQVQNVIDRIIISYNQSNQCDFESNTCGDFSHLLL